MNDLRLSVDEIIAVCGHKQLTIEQAGQLADILPIIAVEAFNNLSYGKY